MVSSRPARMRSAPVIAAATLLALLWAASAASAAAIQDEAALPSIFSASLEAQLDPQGEDTSCEVQYKTLAGFETGEWAGADSIACSPEAIGSTDPAQRVTAELPGLATDTEYRYRFVATASDATHGPGGTFHTFGIEAFTMEAIDAASNPASAAGSHPYELVTLITLPHGEVKGADGAAAVAKDVLAELPPGLIGNPTAVEQCSARLAEERRCSGDSQVGVLRIRSAGQGPNIFNSQVFNMTPAKGQAARLGGEINLSTNAYIGAGVRTGDDYGINAGSFNLSTITNPFEFEIRLWGVPANPAHDPQRVCEGVKGCSVTPGTPERPFLRNPTRCAGPLEARIKVDSYDLPGTFFTEKFDMPAITECDKLEFEPTIEIDPSAEVADSPTGLEVDLHVPQNEDPGGLATADLRDAAVELPEGIAINPSGANGLESCSPGQIGLTSPIGESPVRTTAAPASCPDAAKIGTVRVDTPLLDHELPGAVYVAEPYRNPFDSLLAIYIAVHDPDSGVVVKLAGEVEADPERGQLSAGFSENPQLPFSRFRLDFFDGPRAALRTPRTCGGYESDWRLTPWSAPASGPPARGTDRFQVERSPLGGECPGSEADLANAQGFLAGTLAPTAGAYSPLVTHLTRPDGTQEIKGLNVALPPGLAAKLAGTPYCSEADLAAAAAKEGKEEQASPSCPAASRVGSVSVGAGAGPEPYYADGTAYLAGPYKGAPLSLATITPAVAGPYDLGTVVVRAALRVDPRTAQVRAISDPLPTILKGVPLDLRDIRIAADRPAFTLNPTSCEPMLAGGEAITVADQINPLAARFQVGECGRLGFKPRISLRLFGGIKRAKYQGLRAVVRPRPGDANIGRTVVRMPRSAFLAQEHIRTVCTRVQFAADACPKGAIYGRALAYSPLLGYPARGNVYLRSSDNTLPDLVADLRGPAHQPVRVELVGRTDSVKGALRNTFDVVPDTPVSYFRLQLFGGKKSLIVNSRNICAAKKNRAVVAMRAHNGRRALLRPALANERCVKVRAKRKRDKRSAKRQLRVARVARASAVR